MVTSSPSSCHNFCSSITLFLIALFSVFSENSGKDCHEFESPHMGANFKITVYHHDHSEAGTAADSAFAYVDAINQIFSTYVEDSELNLLSKSSGSDTFIKVSDELYDVLTIAHNVSEKTNGAFDITIGPLTNYWRNIRDGKYDELPDRQTLDSLIKPVGYKNIKFIKPHQKIKLKANNMQFDMGGIAKGYAAKRMAKIIEHYGISQYLVNAGGDIYAGSPPPGADYWQVAVPFYKSRDDINNQLVAIENNAITTSGELFQYVEINGERYSHIVNPETGLGLKEFKSATVIGNNPTIVDAYATALNVMTPKDGIALINAANDYEALIQAKSGKTIEHYKSEGFNNYFKDLGDKR